MTKQNTKQLQAIAITSADQVKAGDKLRVQEEHRAGFMEAMAFGELLGVGSPLGKLNEQGFVTVLRVNEVYKDEEDTVGAVVAIDGEAYGEGEFYILNHLLSKHWEIVEEVTELIN